MSKTIWAWQRLPAKKAYFIFNCPMSVPREYLGIKKALHFHVRL